MIHLWYDDSRGSVRLQVEISALARKEAPPAPTHAEFNEGGGISLDFLRDAGWQGAPTVQLPPESVAVALLRLAWVAAWHEIQASQV